MEQREQTPKLPYFLRNTKHQAKDRRLREEQRINCSLSLLVEGEQKNVTFEKMPVLRDPETGKMTGIMVNDDKQWTSIIMGWHHMTSLCTHEKVYPSPFGDERTVLSPFDVDEAVPPTPYPEDCEKNPFNMAKSWCPEPPNKKPKM